MRVLASAAVAVSTIAASPAAAELREYNPSLLSGLQARGDRIVLFVTAGSCPQCPAADTSVQEFASRKAYEHVHVLRIDAVKDQRVARSYGARTQPTIIALHGFDETGRMSGPTDPASLSKLFDSTLR